MKEAIIQFLSFGLVPVGGFAILLFFWNLIQAPNRIKLDKANKEILDLKQEHTELQKQLKQSTSILEKPKPKLTSMYKVLSTYPDDSFDCRIFVHNTGMDPSRHTTVCISFVNLDIVTTLWGNCQRIDDLRNNRPTIQWDYAGNVIHHNLALKILDLKLKIKVANQVSYIISEFRAENMNKTTDIHILNIGEIEVIKSKIDKGQDAYMEKIDPTVIAQHLKGILKQDIDTEDSEI